MLNIFDLILPPLYLLVIFFVADIIRKKNIHEKPHYKYFVKGLFVKIFGAIAVCLIYTLYYDGGDTTNYFYYGADVLRKLLFYKPHEFFSVWLGDLTLDKWSIFDTDTGWPLYWHDEHSFFVTRFITPLGVLSGSSFIVCSILLATFCYGGIWRLFEVFIQYFPQVESKLAIAILFMPSVVFWGSGLLKDTITLSAVGWYLYGFNALIINKNKSFFPMLALFLSSLLLIKIKPYILFALLPGSMIWYLTNTLWRIKNFFLKMTLTPILLLAIGAAGYGLLSSLGSSLGQYSIDNVMERAVIVQRDLKQEYYGGNARFDIGDFDATFSSMITKAPAAIEASLFRPYLWEAKNPVMALAALENAVVLFLTIFLVIKLKIVNIIFLVRKNSLLLFSFLFAIFFAFSVGIATSNFGALVRYKIPLIPFYMSFLFVLKWYYDSAREKGLDHVRQSVSEEPEISESTI